MGVRVSYIVATRNRIAHIARALDNLKELKGPEDELIVVDGDSTDGTHEILKAAEPGLIDILIHEKDLGEGHAMNKGFQLARGRYIKGITDDDVFFRGPLEQAYRAMDEHPEIDLLETGGESINQIKDPTNLKPVHYQWYPDDARLNETSSFVEMNGLGMVLRRSSLPILGFYDPRHLHADTSYLTQATVRGACLRYLRCKVFSHRVGAQSNSLWNVRKKYIYRDFGFTKLSRWRYLKRPGAALRWFLERAGLLSTDPGPEPLWDGALLA